MKMQQLTFILLFTSILLQECRIKDDQKLKLLILLKSDRIKAQLLYNANINQL